MGWSIGYDGHWNRDIGYGVPATCDYPKCRHRIDRGLSYVCGGEPYGGDHGCGLFFCEKHLVWGDKQEDIDNNVPEDDRDIVQLCERCEAGQEPFTPKPDLARWLRWKLKHESWAGWRAANPNEVEKIREQLKARAHR